jgi:hypothetical protein
VFQNRREDGGHQYHGEKLMTETNEKEIRAVVRDELLGIINDAKELLGMGKDPTGIGKKALEGLANVIRRRQPNAKQNGG